MMSKSRPRSTSPTITPVPKMTISLYDLLMKENCVILYSNWLGIFYTWDRKRKLQAWKPQTWSAQIEEIGALHMAITPNTLTDAFGKCMEWDTDRGKAARNTVLAKTDDKGVTTYTPTTPSVPYVPKPFTPYVPPPIRPPVAKELMIGETKPTSTALVAITEPLSLEERKTLPDLPAVPPLGLPPMLA